MPDHGLWTAPRRSCAGTAAPCPAARSVGAVPGPACPPLPRAASSAVRTLSDLISPRPHSLQRYTWTRWRTVTALTILGMSVVTKSSSRHSIRSVPWQPGHLAHRWRSSTSTGSLSSVFPCPGWAPGRLFPAAPPGSFCAFLRSFCWIGFFDDGVWGLSYTMSLCLRSATSLTSSFLAESAIFSESTIAPSRTSIRNTAELQLAQHAQSRFPHALLSPMIRLG